MHPLLPGLIGALLLASAPVAQQQTSVLTPTGAVASDHFGQALARDADRLLIGAAASDLAASGGGAVYAFTSTPSGWASAGVLTAGDATDDAAFGTSVALEGDVAVIGAPGDGAGAAYVFGWVDGVGWVERHKLAPSGPTSGDFGHAVAISLPRILVGAPREDNPVLDEGAAYVFVQGLFGIFVEEDRLTPAVPWPDARFGESLDLDGDSALIGAPNHSELLFEAGAAYRFTRTSGSGWAEAQRLLPSDPNINAGFGQSVDLLAGKRAVIGAPQHLGPTSSFGDGAAYVFLPGILTSSWFEWFKLKATVPQDASLVGRSVDQQGERILVGASFWDVDAVNSGAILVFDLVAGSWVQTAVLHADHPAPQAYLGHAVVFGDGEAIAGAPAWGQFGTAVTFDLDLDPDPYGCGVNPEGSLVQLGGAPDLGDTWILGVHNPLGSQSPGSSAFLALRFAPDGLYPCGTSLPGWGMAGPGENGELLVAPDGPGLVSGPLPWDGAHPVPLNVSVPPDPILVSQRIYVQGLLVDPGGSGVPIALTEALESVIGP